MRELTTTSYIALAFLRSHSYSAYELVRQMARTLRYMWPKAERNLYYELKNLDQHGLVASRSERRGRRDRTVYSITDAGLEALQQWMALPAAGLQIEFEAVARVFFADAGTKEQLLENLERIRTYMRAWQDEGRAIAADYLAGTAPSQERAHVTSFIFPFYWGVSQLVERWAREVEVAVSQWDDLTPTEEKLLEAMARFSIPWSEADSTQTP